jgi:hypothetical protein
MEEGYVGARRRDTLETGSRDLNFSVGFGLARQQILLVPPTV